MPTHQPLDEILGRWMVNSTWAKAMLRGCSDHIRLSDLEHERLIMAVQLQLSHCVEKQFELSGSVSAPREEALQLLKGFFVFLNESGVVVLLYRASGNIVDPQDLTEFAFSAVEEQDINSPPDDTLDGLAKRQVRPTKPSDDGGAGEDALSEPSDSDDPTDVTEEDSSSEPSEPARNVGIATPRTNAFVWPHVMISSAQVLAGLAIAFVRTTTSPPKGIDPSFTQDFTPSPSNLLALEKNNPVETVTPDTCSPSCQEDKPSPQSPHSDDPQVDMTISFEERTSANAMSTNAETQVFATNLNEVNKFSLEGSFISIVDGITQLFSPTSDSTHVQRPDPTSTAKNVAYLFSEPVNKIFLAQDFKISMLDRWGTSSNLSSENSKSPSQSTYALNLPEITTIIPVAVESKSLPSIDNVPVLSTEKPGDRPLDDQSLITDKAVKPEPSVDPAPIPRYRAFTENGINIFREEDNRDRLPIDIEPPFPVKIDLPNNIPTLIVIPISDTSWSGEKIFARWLSFGDLEISADSLADEWAMKGKGLLQNASDKKPQGMSCLSAIEISGFTGVGRGSSPSSSRLLEIDTLQFIGSGLTARYLQMEQQNQDVVITFEGNELTKVTLKNINLDEIDNLDPSTGASLKVGNIIFDGDESIKDNFDVFNSDWYRNTLLNKNTTTFLNNLDNFVYGFDDSDDVVNGQGGNDTIFGLGGNDLLRGGSGDDVLNGGLGHNRLVGNTGNDTFVIVPGGMSDIMDFTLGQDKIQLSEGSYTSLQFEFFAEGGRGGTQIRQNGQVVGRIFGISSNLLTPDQFVQHNSFDRPS
jgi:hypothetical protein